MIVRAQTTYQVIINSMVVSFSRSCLGFATSTKRSVGGIIRPHGGDMYLMLMYSSLYTINPNSLCNCHGNKKQEFSLSYIHSSAAVSG